MFRVKYNINKKFNAHFARTSRSLSLYLAQWPAVIQYLFKLKHPIPTASTTASRRGRIGEAT